MALGVSHWMGCGRAWAGRAGRPTAQVSAECSWSLL